MLTLALAINAVASPPPPNAVADLAALYDKVCLQAFPDDAAVERFMATTAAVRLTEVRRYLHDDPGIGWDLPDAGGKTIVTIEAPPYHACAVRREMPVETVDLAAFHTLADRFEAANGTFEKMAPMKFDINGQHSVGAARARMFPDGSGEALMVFENRPIAPTPGMAPLEIRFVHQRASANAR